MRPAKGGEAFISKSIDYCRPELPYPAGYKSLTGKKNPPDGGAHSFFSRPYCYAVMIGYCHDTVLCPSVCLSVCLSVMIVYCGAQGRSRDWKFYSRLPRTALPIHFFRHFCCRMYRSATNRRTVYLHNRTAEISASGIAMVTWTCCLCLFQTGKFRPFGCAVYGTSYPVRSALLATATLLVYNWKQHQLDLHFKQKVKLQLLKLLSNITVCWDYLLNLLITIRS